MISHLEQLRKAHPGFNWPDPPEPRNYPQVMFDSLGDIKHFGFPPRKYKRQWATSCEKSALEDCKKLHSEGKATIITFDPIRLETYGIWVRL